MDRKRNKESSVSKIKTSRKLHDAMKDHYIHGNVPAYMRLYAQDKCLRSMINESLVGHQEVQNG